jgi:hypothetical protein
MQNFNEWMSIRQMNEPLAPEGSYQFSGTYDSETIPDLIDNSEIISIDEAKKLIPSQYEQQFTGEGDYQAGKALNENDKEIVWVCNEAGTVYLFEKV